MTGYPWEQPESGLPTPQQQDTTTLDDYRLPNPDFLNNLDANRQFSLPAGFLSDLQLMQQLDAGPGRDEALEEDPNVVQPVDRREELATEESVAALIAQAGANLRNLRTLGSGDLAALCQLRLSALTPEEQARLGEFGRALDVATRTEPRGAHRDSAALRCSELRSQVVQQPAQELNRLSAEATFVAVLKNLADQQTDHSESVNALTKLIHDRPDLATTIANNPEHNQLHNRLLQYAAVTGAGRNPLFVEALFTRGGHRALDNLHAMERRITTTGG
jgi:hypothetical protein